MTVPGLIWMPGDDSTPAQLTSRLQSVLGAALIGFYTGEDLVSNESGDVPNWPGRVGGEASNTSANLFRTTTVNGRKMLLNPNVTAYKSLTTTLSASVKSVLMVAIAITTPAPATETAWLCGAFAHAVATGASALYVDTGSTLYVNGISDNAVGAAGSLRIYEIDNDTAGSSAIQLGGRSSGRGWDGAMGCFVCLSTIPTAEQRASVTQALTRYYSIPLP